MMIVETTKNCKIAFKDAFHLGPLSGIRLAVKNEGDFFKINVKSHK